MDKHLIVCEVRWPGREEASLTVELASDDTILRADLYGIGGPEFLRALCDLRARLTGSWREVALLPQGNRPSDLLLRELILKARGEWHFPYEEEELCHCRAVPTAVVDQAICRGAQTPQKVSALTSASTACGTCRPNVEAIIKYRLQRS